MVSVGRTTENSVSDFSENAHDVFSRFFEFTGINGPVSYTFLMNNEKAASPWMADGIVFLTTKWCFRLRTHQMGATHIRYPFAQPHTSRCAGAPIGPGRKLGKPELIRRVGLIYADRAAFEALRGERGATIAWPSANCALLNCPHGNLNSRTIVHSLSCRPYGALTTRCRISNGNKRVCQS